jgi:hypothetical protein
MVEDLSNRTLAILLIAAIAISLGGTILSLNRLSTVMNMPSITGYVLTPTGTTNVTIQSQASLRFSIPGVDFGSGTVNTNASNQNCSMATNKVGASAFKDASGCTGFNASTTFISLELENDGNTNLTVNLTGVTAATFLGGTTPAFKFKVSNNESNSCLSPGPQNWTEVNATSMTVCTAGKGLDYLDNSDSLTVDINISIPYNAITGSRTATLTATGQVAP